MVTANLEPFLNTNQKKIDPETTPSLTLIVLLRENRTKKKQNEKNLKKSFIIFDWTVKA